MFGFKSIIFLVNSTAYLIIHVRWVMSRVRFPVSDVVPGCKANSTKPAEFHAKNKETGAEKIASAKRMTLVSRTSTVVRMFFFSNCTDQSLLS